MAAWQFKNWSTVLLESLLEGEKYEDSDVLKIMLKGVSIDDQQAASLEAVDTEDSSSVLSTVGRDLLTSGSAPGSPLGSPPTRACR